MKHHFRLALGAVCAAWVTAALPTGYATAAPPPAPAPTPAASPSSEIGTLAVPPGCRNTAIRNVIVSGTLSNGRIDTRVCSNSSRNVSEVHTVYQKDAGPEVRLRNFWEFTNASGGSSGRRYYDIGEFRAVAGRTYPYSWVYYPNQQVGPAGYTCVRGGVRDVVSGLDYTTRVTCP